MQVTNTKKMGFLLVVAGLIFSFLLINQMNSLTDDAEDHSCYVGEECQEIATTLSLSHFLFGFLGFFLGLGFYLVFFAQGEEALMQRLEEQKQQRVSEERFDLIAKGLDAYEKKVLQSIKDQEGITQNTLRLRTSMSKAKLSYVLQDLESKGLVVKEKQGKTNAIFLKEAF